MQSTRQLSRAILRRTPFAPPSSRFLSSSFQLRAEDNARRHPNADAYGESQKNKPEVPHMTNTTSTFDEKMPSIGKDKPPPEVSVFESMHHALFPLRDFQCCLHGPSLSSDGRSVCTTPHLIYESSEARSFSVSCLTGFELLADRKKTVH